MFGVAVGNTNLETISDPLTITARRPEHRSDDRDGPGRGRLSKSGCVIPRMGHLLQAASRRVAAESGSPGIVQVYLAKLLAAACIVGPVRQRSKPSVEKTRTLGPRFRTGPSNQREEPREQEAETETQEAHNDEDHGPGLESLHLGQPAHSRDNPEPGVVHPAPHEGTGTD